MTETTIFETFTQIGGVLGTGASLVLFWMYNKIKSLQSEVDALKTDNKTTQQTLADIRADVSFIRGKLEDK